MERKPNPAPNLEEYADLGDSVHWFAGGDVTLKPLTGFVIEKSPGGGPGMSNLTIATFTGSGFAIQEGVRHMTHPLVRRQGNSGGGWAHRPIDLAFKKLLLAIGLLKWDGDETYRVDPEFDGASFGAAILEAAGATSTFAEVRRSRRGRATGGEESSPPPPPPPPTPPPTSPPTSTAASGAAG